MITAPKIRAGVAAAMAVGVVAALAGCASSDPLDSGSSNSSDSKTIVVGSQQYYSERDHRRALRPGPREGRLRGQAQLQHRAA
ncbi:hypothetical protein Q9Q99_00990 [Curtobacterium flaccumfaciens]|nr:hypothetical protein Q9Q99_00990 [Curtobacterium flaccumfaciens]